MQLIYRLGIFFKYSLHPRGYAEFLKIHLYSNILSNCFHDKIVNSKLCQSDNSAKRYNYDYNIFCLSVAMPHCTHRSYSQPSKQPLFFGKADPSTQRCNYQTHSFRFRHIYVTRRRLTMWRWISDYATFAR